MKKITVATLALSASASFAFIGPGAESKTYCLNKYEDANGAVMVGTCDESRNNEDLGRELNSQGCAEGQVAMTATKHAHTQQFSPVISSCLPPNVAQL